MKKKIIPTLVAIVLIIIIAGIAFGEDFMKSIRYSSERADLDDYFGVAGNQLAIVLQDEIVEEKALLRDGKCYFDQATVSKYFGNGFYLDEKEGCLLYTTPADVYSVKLGGSLVTDIFYADMALEEDGTQGEGQDTGEDRTEELGYTAAFVERNVLYIAADYIERYMDCATELFDLHVQVYTQWEGRYLDSVMEDTELRLEGDPKSSILCDLLEEAEVELLAPGEEWSLVKTEDSLIGYVENKNLKDLSGKEEGSAGTGRYEEAPEHDFAAPEYTSLSLDGKVVLGFHSIGSKKGNATLDEMLAGAEGMNVIAPTWFGLEDEEGGFYSYASSDYVTKAHGAGLQVWGVWDDFNHNLENNSDDDVLAVLSSTASRQKLAKKIVKTALETGLDGVNIDFERVTQENGTHFVQFLRELSILCRKNHLFLSVDDYVPYDYRAHYGIDVQGLVADYVIIMGYDEHWHASGDPGSVASIGYVRDGISRAVEKVPAEKVVNALPFYTRVWKSDSTVTDETLSIRNTKEYLADHNVTPQWDEETCQNYASWTEGETLYQVWIEDEESIAVKLNVMSVQNIGGAAVWRLGFGTPQIWEQIRAYAAQ